MHPSLIPRHERAPLPRLQASSPTRVTLRAPGSDSSTPPGAEVTYFEVIDKNPALIRGGGNSDGLSASASMTAQS